MDMFVYSVIVAAIIYIVIGYIWYAKPVFGEQWMKLSKMTKKDAEKSMGTALFGMIIIAIIQAFFLAKLIMELKNYSIMGGIQVGFFTWLGFIATTQLSAVLYEKKPVQLYVINVGCYLLAYLIMGGTIAHMMS